MHTSEHISQELAILFGAPQVEHWEVKLGQEELSNVLQYSDRGRAHDVSLIIHRDESLAVIRKHGYPKGAFRFPSGGINPAESVLDGASREAKEETGLDIDLDNYLLRVNVTFAYAEKTVLWTTHVLVASVVSGELVPVDIKEIEEAQWMSWQELRERSNVVLRSSGLGGLVYRARLHDRAYELCKASIC